MSFLNAIRDYARTRRASRNRLNAYLRVAELPSDIRKDIGWPDADGFGEDVRIHRTRPARPAAH